MIDLHSPREAVDWLRRRVAGGELQVDSRRIGTGDGFIAWPGAKADGRQYVHDALARGAAACLVEREGVQRFGLAGEALGCLEGLKAATGEIAAAWHGEPSEQLDLLAVTGTNGKTSTAWWLAQALSGLEGPARVPTGLVGTLGVGLAAGPGAAPLSETGLTTPDPVTLQRWLRRFVDAGLAACAIEASSIGVQEGRLDGSRIRVAIFTNFSQDHLDYHGSMQAYWHAKAALFAWPGLKAAVINIDDAQGAELAASLRASSLDLWTVSLKDPARLQARDIELHAQGLRFTVAEGERSHRLETALVGGYNLSNLLGVIGAMRSLNVPLEAAIAACRSLTPVPGRMQHLGGGSLPLVVIDYAHTPDALEKVLGALRPLARARGGRLGCVFGCGGDRDRAKRAPMAGAVERNTDWLVLTSDNPRSEAPEAILGQMIEGLSRPGSALVQPDRARAIAEAVAGAAVADVICIAGKGHETTQEIQGVKQPFSDAAHAASAIERRAAGQSNASDRARACA